MKGAAVGIEVMDPQAGEVAITGAGFERRSHHKRKSGSAALMSRLH